MTEESRDEQMDERTVLFDTLFLNETNSELISEETDEENVVKIKVVEHDDQHGPRVQTAEISPITIHYYEDVDAVIQKHLHSLLDEETFIDDDVLPTDLIENEYSRISRRALSAWSKFVDTFLTVTEALATHIVNDAQLPVSGKGMLVIDKDTVLEILQKQIKIWDDFSERFDEYRDSLAMAVEESEEEAEEGIGRITVIPSSGRCATEAGNIVREIKHIMILHDSKLKNTLAYRRLLSEFYMKTCSIFGQSVVVQVQTLQKNLRNLKSTTSPLLKQVAVMMDQKQIFCRKESQALVAIQKAIQKTLLPVAPRWFQDWHETVVGGDTSVQSIDHLSQSINFLAAQISFWLQELLQTQSDADATAKKKRGRRPQVSAPPVHLTNFHKIIDDVERSIEAGNRSLVAFWVKDEMNVPPIQDAVNNLKKLSGDLEVQRVIEQKDVIDLITLFKSAQNNTAALIDTLQAVLEKLNSKLGLLNVMEYAAAQAESSIRSNIVTFLHNECQKTNTAIRTMKAHLEAKVANRTRELRTMIEEDTELQRKISNHFSIINLILDTLKTRDEDYRESVIDVRAVVKRLFSLKSVYQDLSFVDHVRESAKSEYETLLNKFKSLKAKDA